MEMAIVSVGLGILNSIFLFILNHLYKRLNNMEERLIQVADRNEVRALIADKLAPVAVRLESIDLKLDMLITQLRAEIKDGKR